MITNDSQPVYTLTVLEFTELTKNLVLECLKELKPEQNSTLPRYRTRKEVKEILDISYPTLNRYSKMGLIQSQKVGSRVLYSEDSIKEALKTQHKYVRQSA